jgi:hypothetical protein
MIAFYPFSGMHNFSYKNSVSFILHKKAGLPIVNITVGYNTFRIGSKSGIYLESKH